MSDLLRVEKLKAGYGAYKVLHGISFAVTEGKNIGLFGPNGHGKTTLLDTISGLIRADSGAIHFDGNDITRVSSAAIVEMGLVHVSQGNTLFPQMTVLEALNLGAFSKRARPRKSVNLERVFSMFPRLTERVGNLCRTLSGGERQMLNLATGLMACPRLLILDEPTLGLSPLLKAELAGSIAKIEETGVPLIIVEQDIEFLLSLTQQLLLVNHGEITQRIERGSDELSHEAIMKEYFGVGDGNEP